MTTNNIPLIYDIDKYIEWHEKNIISDVPLKDNINKFRDNLKKDYRQYFTELGHLLSQIDYHCNKEIKIQFKNIIKGGYTLPMKEFAAEETSIDYNNLFKPTNSIIEKLWRKNLSLNSNFINLQNIKSIIKDLARASVICPSLLFAKFYADRLKEWETIIEPSDRNKHMPTIKDVIVDDEAKLASGYFAYHATISFGKNDFIEIQIYSQLSSIWRDLSHNLYADSRIGIIKKEGFGQTNTRLVSLGHMLHLAECEIVRIQQEIIDN